MGDDDSDGPMLDDIHAIVKPDDQKSVSGITGNSGEFSTIYSLKEIF